MIWDFIFSVVAFTAKRVSIVQKKIPWKNNFAFYDINEPLGHDIKQLQANSFDFILADPPFWLEEVLLKLFETINYLTAPKSKVLICAGPPMTDFLGDRVFYQL